MTISKSGLEFIKEAEGMRLRPYQDGAGYWTIGYGHRTGIESSAISANQAMLFLLEDVAIAEETINKLVSTPLTQNQFDALVSFTFNVGREAFRDSTLLIELNFGNFTGAALQFQQWSYSNKVFIPGLFMRRCREATLFVS